MKKILLISTIFISFFATAQKIPSGGYNGQALVKTTGQNLGWTSKQDSLQSGTTIKTINGSSLLGSGNLDLVPYTGAIGDVDLNSKSLKNVDSLGVGLFTPRAVFEVQDGKKYLSSTSTAHGMTSIAPTNVIGIMEKNNSAGGLAITGLSQSALGNGVDIIGAMGVRSDTIAPVRFASGLKSGTGIGGMDDTALAFDFTDYNIKHLLSIFGDGRVGIRNTSPSRSALLDIKSTTKGLLIPRMTTTQRNAISSPATGLLIYNTTTSAFNVYNSGWGVVGQNIANANLTANASYTTTFTGFDWTLKGGTFTRIGSGATSGTYTAKFHNSSGTSNSLIIRDDGNIGINTASPDLKLTLASMAVDDGFHMTSTGTGEVLFRSAGANEVSMWLVGTKPFHYDTRDGSQSYSVGRMRWGATGVPDYLVDVIAAVDDGISVSSSSSGSVLIRSAGANDVSIVGSGSGGGYRFDTRTSQQSRWDISSFVFGATTADASAKLEVSSTTQGFRITPMTATQASAITPSEGLMVCVSNTNGTFLTVGFWGYQGGVWIKM